MKTCKPVATPMEIEEKLHIPDEHSNQVLNENHRKIIGSLMYAMVGTRPDISYALSSPSRFLENPTESQFKAVTRGLRYIRGTSRMQLRYDENQSKEIEIIGFSDSNWANDTIYRRSTTGYFISFLGGTISWRSQRQKTVALSSTEAEYIALCSVNQVIIWLRSFLNEIGYNQINPSSIFADNQGAIAIAKNTSHKSRTRHIDIKFHFIKEKVSNNEVEIKYIASESNSSDILTKPTTKIVLLKHLEEIGLVVIN